MLDKLIWCVGWVVGLIACLVVAAVLAQSGLWLASRGSYANEILGWAVGVLAIGTVVGGYLVGYANLLDPDHTSVPAPESFDP